MPARGKTLFPTLNDDEVPLQSKRTNCSPPLCSSTRGKSSAPAERLPKSCTLARRREPALRETPKISPAMPVANCNLQNVYLKKGTLESIELLSIIINPIPLRCLREIRNFELPQKILSHSQPVKRDIQEVFYEISTQAFYIFHQHTCDSTWEKEILTLIQHGLYAQQEYLKLCLKAEKTENDVDELKDNERQHSGAQPSQQSSLNLKAYFQRIENYLKDKKYSQCAWKIVRVEIRRCFLYFLRFAELLERK
ncbi:interferon kappa [Ctenodactylus gundi]